MAAAALTANEAAVAAGVPLRQVHRIVDAGLLGGAAAEAPGGAAAEGHAHASHRRPAAGGVKFLIDERLSPSLAQIARRRGFHESMHVTWLGMRSRKDWTVARRAIDEGFVLVTNNAADFTPLYGAVELIDIAAEANGRVRLTRYRLPPT